MENYQLKASPSNLNVLMSAYACRPDKGSEPGVGWNMAKEMASHHNVWVITREDNRQAIEAELSANLVQNLHVVFYDLPVWARWWKGEQRGIHLHHYLWQLGIYFLAQKLNQEHKFDVIHHVTYGRHSSPSFLSFMPVPIIWGPVGGGESAPVSFWDDFSFSNKMYEILRILVRWIGEHDPFVLLTAQRSKVAIVATPETRERLKFLGAKRIETIYGQTGINREELEQLSKIPTVSNCQSIRFVSIGRLLHWKGFHLGLKAFALANLESAEYWVIGDGSERKALEDLSKNLGISDHVKFFGSLAREQTLLKLGECDVLVHPSLHDFSPTVCLEAMAAGRPIICLDMGGPATQVTELTGVKVPVNSPGQAIQEMSKAMVRLSLEPDLRIQMGKAGQQRVSQLYSWESKGKFLTKLYYEAVHGGIN